MFTPETGGTLNKVYHFYAYKDLAERETVRQDMMDREKWLRFLQKSRPHLLGPQVPFLSQSIKFNKPSRRLNAHASSSVE
jgi:hypothetical protein